MNRRGYLDWLRGVGVLIMIEAHTLDSWTRAADRTRGDYRWAIVVGGFGAPVFLFLAGIALALAAGSRIRRGMGEPEAAARARRRAWQIFGLAFLFRLQSWLISGGGLAALLKVDILNVMGISMVGAALLWGAGRHNTGRALLMVLTTLAVAMLTPVIRASQLLDAVPWPIEGYFRPFPGRTTFTLFPWAGFLLAGGAVGIWLDAAQSAHDERRANQWLAAIGPLLALGGYAASFQPPIYTETSFWTSSPTFFFVRLGILVTAIPIAYAWNGAWTGRSPLREFGAASLFVYWIHVEMVYGILTLPIHRRLTFDQALAACALFSLLMFGLVKLKNRLRKDSLLVHRLGQI